MLYPIQRKINIDMEYIYIYIYIIFLNILKSGNLFLIKFNLKFIYFFIFTYNAFVSACDTKLLLQNQDDFFKCIILDTII